MGSLFLYPRNRENPNSSLIFFREAENSKSFFLTFRRLAQSLPATNTGTTRPAQSTIKVQVSVWAIVITIPYSGECQQIFYFVKLLRTILNGYTNSQSILSILCLQSHYLTGFSIFFILETEKIQIVLLIFIPRNREFQKLLQSFNLR